MIKDIEISNFRCFEHTKIAGFERVNLIGGQKQLALLVFVCYFLLWIKASKQLKSKIFKIGKSILILLISDNLELFLNLDNFEF
jgi:hypothetical protein